MKISFILKSIVAFFAAFSLNVFAAGTASDAPSDAHEQLEHYSINEGTAAIAFTVTDPTTNSATFSSTLIAESGSVSSLSTDANANVYITLASNHPEGFKLSLTSQEDGNFLSNASGVISGTTCDGETGVEDGDNAATVATDGLCISYEIACEKFQHHLNDVASGTDTTPETLFNDAADGTFVRLEETATVLWDASADTYGGSGDVTYKGTVTGQDKANAQINCQMRFASGEDIKEVTEGTYTDTITLTYTPQ